VRTRPMDLDPRTADRLLDGRVAAEDAPPGYQEVAHLLAVAARDDVQLTDTAAVSAVVDAIRSGAQSPRPRRSLVLSKIRSARSAAVVGLALMAATGTAAATGNLPGAAQTNDDREVVDLPDNANSQATDSTTKAHDDDSDAAGAQSQGKAEGQVTGGGASSDNWPEGEHGLEVVTAVRAAQDNRGEAGAASGEAGSHGIGATVSEVANDSGEATAAEHGRANAGGQSANADANANGGAGNPEHPRQNDND
jgi:hypothetical protein